MPNTSKQTRKSANPTTSVKNVRVRNCALPNSVAGFVEGELCNVLINALSTGHLRPIAQMGTNSVRDKTKPGAAYVYFRVMKTGETVNNMAFGSVGSALSAYKARMLFKPCIWTNSSGGYVCDHDGMGRINNTPFSQEEQRKVFDSLLTMGKTARGNAEVGIFESVSMSDLDSAWCVFPYSEARITAYLNAPQTLSRTSVSKKDTALATAADYYSKITKYLKNATDKGVIGSNSTLHWIKFY